MEPDCRTYLEKYFPGTTGVGVRRPTGKKFRRMSGLPERPKLVIGHSFVERMARNEVIDEDDSLVVGWIGFSGASMEQVLTAVYRMIDGEFRHLEVEIVIVAWENSIMNGMTEKEADAILKGVVAEQEGGGLPHRIFIAECSMSPSLLKAGRSAIVYRVNKLVKETNRRLGAHQVDFEKSVGKVVARKDFVGLKRGMWEGEGRDAYHPNDVGASRMASWVREFLRHGTNVMDPDYPPRNPRKRSTVGPEPASRDRRNDGPVVVVPPYWGKTKQKEEERAAARPSRSARRRERSEPPRRREERSEGPRTRSSSVESECRMDSAEERMVDSRARVEDSEGSDTGEIRTVRDLISLEEDPLEGTSSRYGGSVLEEALSTPLPVSQGSLESPVGSEASGVSKKRKRDGDLLEADEEGMEVLEAQWDAGKAIMRGIFRAKKRLIIARAAGEASRVARAKKEMDRKRKMLKDQLSGLQRLALRATEYSEDESSSSSSSGSDSSSEDEAVVELQQTSKKLKSVREASSRPMRQ